MFIILTSQFLKLSTKLILKIIKEILKTNLPLHAIDVNSKFEIEPGLKNIEFCRDALQCVSTMQIVF